MQIKLTTANAPCFENAKLLIAADCAAYVHANFHQEFMIGKVILIGCPKLDGMDYSKKLTEILRRNENQRVTIVRMEVSCCGGLEYAAAVALKNSGEIIPPWQVVILSTEGETSFCQRDNSTDCGRMLALRICRFE